MFSLDKEILYISCLFPLKTGVELELIKRPRVIYFGNYKSFRS